MKRNISFYLTNIQIKEFCGSADNNIKVLQEELNTNIVVRGNEVKIEIKPEIENLLPELVRQISELLESGEHLSPRRLKYIIRHLKEFDEEINITEVFKEKIKIGTKKGFIKPKTKTQQQYIKAIRENDIVFGIGPAGTGKTYLAMAMAVNYLLAKKIERIILVRPAVEAGEKLGFLPGDLIQKVNPYLRPLYDALYDMLPNTNIQEFMNNGILEVAPLAFMRGRTLNQSFIILDEAQNTTIEQMKMFLTRLGHNSKAVITGDITQIDLPNSQESGLVHVQKILKGIKGIEFIYFSQIDVIRHDLVQKIIDAYEKEKKK